MSRPIPLEPDRFYHIYNRGNNRENLFYEPRHYRYFLRLYAKYASPVLDTLAFCLLPNHFHLAIRVRPPDELPARLASRHQPASRQLQTLFSTYTKAINKARHRSGSLFEKPFERKAITTPAYLTHLITYIHQNPQRHDLVPEFSDWPYSSYEAFAADRPSRLAHPATLEAFGGRQAFSASHKHAADTTLLEPVMLEEWGF